MDDLYVNSDGIITGNDEVKLPTLKLCYNHPSNTRKNISAATGKAMSKSMNMFDIYALERQPIQFMLS
mgnify:FL=1